MRSIVVAALGAAIVAAVLTGRAGGEEPELTVAAAASLRAAFEAYAEEYEGARVRLTFAGSDELAAQIRQGVRPDVYAAANAALPDALFDEGLVEMPTVFATNSLVAAVPSGSAVEGLAELEREGTDVVVGSPSVPVGAYTRLMLDRLPDGGAAIIDNVRSEEPDVAGVIGKVALGAADAGFVYATDVGAADGRIRAIELPAELQPEITYEAAVVVGAGDPSAARAFIDGLLSGPGAAALREAGLGPPPR